MKHLDEFATRSWRATLVERLRRTATKPLGVDGSVRWPDAYAGALRNRWLLPAEMEMIHGRVARCA